MKAALWCVGSAIAQALTCQFVLSVLVVGELAGAAEPVDKSLRVKDLPRSAITVKDWLAQVEAATVQVTGVKLERTDTGLDITLETAEGKPLQVDATKFRTEGNSLIADIPNAVLALPQGNEFRTDEQFSPGGGYNGRAGDAGERGNAQGDGGRRR